MNILREMVQFGVFYVYNGVRGGTSSAVSGRAMGSRGEAESFEATVHLKHLRPKIYQNANVV